MKNNINKIKDMLTEVNYTFIKIHFGNPLVVNTITFIFICDKHRDYGEQMVSYKYFCTSKKGCRKCAAENRGDAKRRSYKEIKELFDKKDYELIDENYINSKTVLRYRCRKHPSTIQTTKAGNIKITSNNCKFCESENASGENAYNWKGDLIPEDSRFRQSEEYKKWRLLVYERDKYTCQACFQHGGSLHAHHIENYSSNIKKRTLVENGITLCKACHSVNVKGSFHNTYGTWNNTKEQLEEFIRTKRQDAIKA